MMSKLLMMTSRIQNEARRSERIFLETMALDTSSGLTFHKNLMANLIKSCLCTNRILNRIQRSSFRSKAIACQGLPIK